MSLENPKCCECGERVSDYYMVNDSIWDEFGCGMGQMHLKCLSKRMERPLAFSDFTDAPINLNLFLGWRLAMDYIDWMGW